jgi:hypothetical protein
METHELKILPQYFNAVQDGSKNFEIRKNDRGFKVGDRLLLKEWDSMIEYTGKEITKEISYIFDSKESNTLYGLEEGYCILGLKDIEPQKVWVHFVRFKDMEHINKIPFPAVFSTYEKLTKYEEQLHKRNDVEVLQVQACIVDDKMKNVESEE